MGVSLPERQMSRIVSASLLLPTSSLLPVVLGRLLAMFTSCAEGNKASVGKGKKKKKKKGRFLAEQGLQVPHSRALRLWNSRACHDKTDDKAAEWGPTSLFKWGYLTHCRIWNNKIVSIWLQVIPKVLQGAMNLVHLDQQRFPPPSPVVLLLLGTLSSLHCFINITGSRWGREKQVTVEVAPLIFVIRKWRTALPHCSFPSCLGNVWPAEKTAELSSWKVLIYWSIYSQRYSKLQRCLLLKILRLDRWLLNSDFKLTGEPSALLLLVACEEEAMGHGSTCLWEDWRAAAATVCSCKSRYALGSKSRP